ncbi:hypothetical protein ACFQPA_11930 [Halomarina halobia]|uniref:Uncharacterized protein n=1 Tax=Halomarina halobia TaxID=3033386 RepID=A0ABD6A9H8_9EURY|nr:hypothetical protein [Halomarina sp. PSR21]
MSTLLTEERRETLVSAARTAIGEDLRSLVYFTPDDWEQLYLRRDLERGADLERFADNERLGFTDSRTYGETELGGYEFTIRAFSKGYVVRVITDDEGAFATTDEIPITLFEEVATALRKTLAQG